MSLPNGGAWPPSPHGISLAQQSLWSAWYVGDPEGLKRAYAGVDPSFGGHADFYHYENGKSGSLQQSGLINRVARYFWSRPNLTGTRKAGIHVPIAADIATASADLLFSEPPQFVCDPDLSNHKAIDRVDELLNCADLHSELIEAAELSAALGGSWLRLVWDKDVADSVIIDAVSADAAFGEWRWGRLTAVTFFSEYADPNDKDHIWRHLERHEPGAILHGLYEGDEKKLGKTVALADHPDTMPYADLVDADGAIPTGVEGLTAAYVANMRPQRRWRKVPELAQLGRSDFDGVEQLMDALDEVYTSWMRDIRLAKSRILVPEFMLTDLGKGQGASWDEDQEVYATLKVAPTDTSSNQITPQQFSIRVTEHQQSAAALVDEILRSAGYSPGTFGVSVDNPKTLTATEVVSRERQSERTRSKKSRYWTQALEPLLDTWLELDAAIFGTGAKGDVDLKWAEEAQVDPLTLAQTANYLYTAAAASTKTLVAMQHPEWDEADIDEEVALIQKEGGVSVPEPAPFASHPADSELTPPTGA